jgi:MFS family permease
MSSDKIPVMSDIQAYIQKHLRFNFIVGMIDGGFFGLGVGFASFAAIIPLFVSHLTDSALLIGLVPAIHNIGWQLPQLFTANWIARAKHFKPLTLWMTIHERVPYLGLAVIALCIPFVSKQTALIMTFLMLIWQGLGAGFAANPWTNMVTKVMPQELHGTFFGTQSAAYNGMAGISAIIAGIILDKVTTPSNYSLCFALTFISMVGSYIFLSMTREPEGTPHSSEHSNAVLHQSLEILKRDINFQIFLGIRMLSQFAGMGFAFYIIYAVRQFGMSDSAAGLMVAILLIGQVVLSPLMGRWGDRWSHRGVMSLGALGAALSALLAWQATSSSWFYPIFILEAIGTVAIWTIPVALSVSFAKSDEERPLYIGMANTLVAPVTILAPIIGGWLVDAVSFSLMFIISAICGVLMTLALWFVMKDPTKENIIADHIVFEE